MENPNTSRPTIPDGYIQDPGKLMSWSFVETKLSEAIHYWICTVYPDADPMWSQNGLW